MSRLADLSSDAGLDGFVGHEKKPPGGLRQPTEGAYKNRRGSRHQSNHHGDEDGDSDETSSGNASASEHVDTGTGSTMSSRAKQPMQVMRQRRPRQTFKEIWDTMQESDYVLNGTIIVENPRKSTGEPFNLVSADIEYYPARLKFDTGSEADLVCLEYLLQAGFDIGMLREVPEDERMEIEGLNKIKYKPQYEVDLKWFRQRDAKVNLTRFLVVEHAPFDILLSSKRFGEEIERRLVSLPLVRPWKKSRGEMQTVTYLTLSFRLTSQIADVIRKEMENDMQKLKEAKELEEQERRTAALIKSTRSPGRVSTINTITGLSAFDIEAGHSDSSRPQA
jgi:hypothetical protein